MPLAEFLAIAPATGLVKKAAGWLIWVPDKLQRPLTGFFGYKTSSKGLTGFFGYRTGSKGPCLAFLGTRPAPKASSLLFLLLVLLQRSLAGFFGYETSPNGLWLTFLATALAPKASGWLFGCWTCSKGLQLAFLATEQAPKASSWLFWPLDQLWLGFLLPDRLQRPLAGFLGH